jgi:hypothetical protein
MRSTLMVCLSDPYAVRHGGTIRSRAFAEALRDAGSRVDIVFPSATMGSKALAARTRVTSPRVKQRVTAAAARLKHEYLPMPTTFGAGSGVVESRIVQGNDDLVLISAMSQAPFSRLARGSLWMDFMDVWSDFARVEAAHRRGLSRWTARTQARLLARGEFKYSSRATIVTAAGWLDAQRLRARGVSAHWLPTPLPDDEFGVAPKDHGAQPVAGLLGNFEYWPNVDAYDYLQDHWLPALTRSGWRVVVAGHGSAKLASRGLDGVELLGPVADVDDFYSLVDLSLAPIRLGGGMKVKVIESLSRGVPVLGTPEALEGLPPEVRALCISAEPGGFVAPPADDLPVVDPHGKALEAFTASGFAIRVRAMLAELRGSGHVE